MPKTITNVKNAERIVELKKARNMKESSVNGLTLDEIEQRMIELATDESTDIVITMANEKKMGMLEKVANLKLQRLRLKELEKTNEQVVAEPITVKFVSSDTDEQKKRLDQIDAEISKGLTRNNA